MFKLRQTLEHETYANRISPNKRGDLVRCNELACGVCERKTAILPVSPGGIPVKSGRITITKREILVECLQFRVRLPKRLECYQHWNHRCIILRRPVVVLAPDRSYRVIHPSFTKSHRLQRNNYTPITQQTSR